MRGTMAVKRMIRKPKQKIEKYRRKGNNIYIDSINTCKAIDQIKTRRLPYIESGGAVYLVCPFSAALTAFSCVRKIND